MWRVDIKGFSEEPFKRLCKVPHAEAVREQAERAKRVHGMHVECVTNVVPTINDSEEELRDIARWIATALGPETPWHVTRFIPYLEFADLRADAARDARARPRDRARGGAATSSTSATSIVPGGEDTVCPACGARAMQRAGFSCRAERVTDDGSVCGVRRTALGMWSRAERCR